jgi:SAM-dependent methyltransferase
MKREALDIYVCPGCHGPLALTSRVADEGEIFEGLLRCEPCDGTYPIAGGVPRFVDSGAYASTFGRQWNWFRTVQIDSQNRSRASADTFRATTGWTSDVLAGRLVLDAGVGAGRFAECAAAGGAVVCGIDLTEAIDAAFANIGRNPGVHLAQADIFSLPFRPGTFDMAYSIGVLHHTPDTEAAFRHVADTVRPGGQMAVYLYARYGLAHRGSDTLRRITTKLPTSLVLGLTTLAIPLHYVYRVPVLGRALNLAAPISPESNWRWRWLDTFDWYSPTYQWKFLYPEVFRWFQANGFHDVEIFDGPIRMRGVKTDRGVDREQPRPQLVAS